MDSAILVSTRIVFWQANSDCIDRVVWNSAPQADWTSKQNCMVGTLWHARNSPHCALLQEKDDTMLVYKVTQLTLFSKRNAKWIHWFFLDQDHVTLGHVEFWRWFLRSWCLFDMIQGHMTFNLDPRKNKWNHFVFLSEKTVCGIQVLPFPNEWEHGIEYCQFMVRGADWFSVGLLYILDRASYNFVHYRVSV